MYIFQRSINTSIYSWDTMSQDVSTFFAVSANNLIRNGRHYVHCSKKEKKDIEELNVLNANGIPHSI